MLDLDELVRIAELKRLSRKHAERDYLIELLLYSIYSIVGKELAFKGGTCLYKIYKLNRFSEDLDFTLNARKINIEKIMEKAIFNLAALNIDGKLIRIKKYKNEINVLLSFKGPLYKGKKEDLCFIPINISFRERILLPLKRESISPIYRELVPFDVFAMDEKEILAEKVRTIILRNQPRDVYDVYFLLKKGIPFDISLVNKKLSLYKMKFDKEEFIKRIEEKKGNWETDLKDLIIGTLPNFEEVKKFIEENSGCF